MAGEREPRSPQIERTLRTLIEWFDPEAATKSPTGMASLIQEQLWQLVCERGGSTSFTTPEAMMKWARIGVRHVLDLPNRSKSVSHREIAVAQEAIMGRPSAAEALLFEGVEEIPGWHSILAVAHLVRAVQSGFYDGRGINPDFLVPQMEKPDVLCLEEETLAAADHLRTGLILLTQQLVPTKMGRVIFH